MRKTAVYQGPDPAFRGVAGYATPTQCDSDVWMFECAGGRCVALQSELRFTSPGDLADPGATDWATLSESIEWRLVLIVAALVAIAYAVIEYGWLFVARPLAGVLCILAFMVTARKS